MTAVKVKLSQWDAITLEALRVHGWSDEELISRIKSGDLPEDKSAFKFNYVDLRKLAYEEEEVLVSAVKNGYTIKFNTIRGIESWILFALNVQGEASFEPGQEMVRVSLTDDQKGIVEEVLAYGWKFVRDENAEVSEGATAYRIEPLERPKFQ